LHLVGYFHNCYHDARIHKRLVSSLFCNFFRRRTVAEVQNTYILIESQVRIVE